MPKDPGTNDDENRDEQNQAKKPSSKNFRLGELEQYRLDLFGDLLRVLEPESENDDPPSAKKSYLEELAKLRKAFPRSSFKQHEESCPEAHLYLDIVDNYHPDRAQFAPTLRQFRWVDIWDSSFWVSFIFMLIAIIATLLPIVSLKINSELPSLGTVLSVLLFLAVLLSLIRGCWLYRAAVLSVKSSGPLDTDIVKSLGEQYSKFADQQVECANREQVAKLAERLHEGSGRGALLEFLKRHPTPCAPCTIEVEMYWLRFEEFWENLTEEQKTPLVKDLWPEDATVEFFKPPSVRRRIESLLENDEVWSGLAGEYAEVEVDIIAYRCERNAEQHESKTLETMLGYRRELLRHLVPFRRRRRRDVILKTISKFHERAWDNRKRATAFLTVVGMFLFFTLSGLWSAYSVVDWSSNSKTINSIGDVQFELRGLAAAVEVFPGQSTFGKAPAGSKESEKSDEIADLVSLRDVAGQWGGVYNSWKGSSDKPIAEKIDTGNINAKENHQTAYNLRELVNHVSNLRVSGDARKEMMASRLQSLSEQVDSLYKRADYVQNLSQGLIIASLITLVAIVVFAVNLTIRFARYQILLRNFYLGRAMALKVLHRSGRGPDGTVTSFSEILGAERLDLGDISVTPLEEAVNTVERLALSQENSTGGKP